MQRKALIAIGVASAVAGLAALGAWAAWLQADETHEVVRTVASVEVTVPLGLGPGSANPGSATARAKCPPGFTATSGGLETADEVWLGLMVPTAILTPDTYYVILLNTAVRQQVVKVTVGCVKKVLKPVKTPGEKAHTHLLSQPAVRSGEATLAPDARKSVPVACPKGTFATAGGFELKDDVQVEGSLPNDSGAGWLFGLKNNEVSDQMVAVQALCTSLRIGRARALSARGHTHSLRLKVVKQAQTVGGTQTATVTAKCPAGFVAVGGGHAVEGHGNWDYGGSTVAGGTRSVTIRNNVVGPLKVIAAAVCLGTTTT